MAGAKNTEKEWILRVKAWFTTFLTPKKTSVD